MDLPHLIDQLSLPVTHPPLSPSHAKTVLEHLEHPLTFSPLLSTPPPTLPSSIAAINTLLKIPSLSTGCTSLDNLLQGGIPTSQGGIFEIYGTAGSGKTQLALQLCLMCTLPPSQGGLDGCAILAVTEGPPPIKRLEQMERIFCNKYSITERSALQRIIVERIADVDELLAWAQFRLPWLLRETDAKLVVLDSVAAVYRPEFEDALSRAPHLVAMAAALKQAVVRNGAGCVCVNQVSQKLNGAVVPALGTVWSHCVGRSLRLGRRGTVKVAGYRGEQVTFDIGEGGVVEVDEG